MGGKGGRCIIVIGGLAIPIGMAGYMLPGMPGYMLGMGAPGIGKGGLKPMGAIPGIPGMGGKPGRGGNPPGKPPGIP